MYNPKSMVADEFINDEEIQETLKYAEENKNNIELINKILEKARPIYTPSPRGRVGEGVYLHHIYPLIFYKHPVGFYLYHYSIFL